MTNLEQAEQREEGRMEGRIEGVLNTLVSLVKDGVLTLSDAAKRANMTVAEFELKTGLKAQFNDKKISIKSIAY
ncbi:MAG: hypothetical protein NC040_09920 [Muribaculaceae bacterium]|nr:hypothetical protein [Alistipes senegalensis]MCM1474365.1 hypothetical protein [Muribaculaceae bacterium]